MPEPLDRLVEALAELPGIGRKTAQRIAFFLLRDRETARELAGAVAAAEERLQVCPICFGLTEAATCAICTDTQRDNSVVCVVEDPADVLTLEQSGQHHGTYHVLGGVLSPIDDVGPDRLHIRELLARVATGSIREVIVATNPTIEGEATAAFLARQLKESGVRVTRIARGLPVGSDLDLADVETISRAFEGRREL
uniref:Recombination protein RecR n=1 Tax=candidate division WOR-3 bacterium TaxID=2052148 RepID=A0A7C4GII2_UNCW3